MNTLLSAIFKFCTTKNLFKYSHNMNNFSLYILIGGQAIYSLWFLTLTKDMQIEPFSVGVA